MIGLEIITTMKGVTYAEIGKKLGISRQAICLWVKDGNIPEDRLEQLSKILDCPAAYLAAKVDVKKLMGDIRDYLK